MLRSCESDANVPSPGPFREARARDGAGSAAPRSGRFEPCPATGSVSRLDPAPAPASADEQHEPGRDGHHREDSGRADARVAPVEAVLGTLADLDELRLRGSAHPA